MNAAMKHTPGPWRWVVGPQVELILVAADYRLGDSFVLAPSEWGSDDEAVNGLNAKLIAAAPTMYHELELAADTFRDMASVLRAIGKDTMSTAAAIAERHIREQLAAIQGGAE